MNKTLLVPIHLDALCLGAERQVVSTMADYSLLPYKYQDETHGTGQDNLSEQILAPLFNKELTLKKGIHLHWSLPDALTNGEHDDLGTTFQQVPNRWLILRQGGNQGEKRWLIESDYLYPIDSGENSPPPNAINILIEPPDLDDIDPNNPNTYQYQRYRYMGRCWELATWQGDSDPKEYAVALTAIGTKATVPIFDEVKATFAAFYPNCHSVFGFCDPEYAVDTPPAGLQYDVIGWYDDGNQDCLQLLLEGHSGAGYEELLEIIEEEFNWTVVENSSEMPLRTLYHSRIVFDTGTRSLSATEKVRSLPDSSLAVAESATEAIAAYVAHSFNPDGEIRQTVAEKLEALQLLERFESRKLDVGAKFREERHEERFDIGNDGFLWSIIPQLTLDTSSSRGIKTRSLNLPVDLAQALNELNVVQEEYNQAWLNIESLRRQLYSQWYYFMKNKGEASTQTIVDTSLKAVKIAIAQAGELEVTEDGVLLKPFPFGIISRLNDKNNEQFFTVYVDALNAAVSGDLTNFTTYIAYELGYMGVTLTNPIVTSPASEVWQIQDSDRTYEAKIEEGILNIYIILDESQIAFRVVNKIQELLAAIETHNTNEENQKYELSQFPSQNYWRANDPIVLLAGEAAKAPHRFGQDGRLNEDGFLECKILDFDIATITNNIEGLQEQIESLKPTEGAESINFITWTESPWNPFAFHWTVFNYPCRETSSGTVQDYTPTQILDNYSLEKNAIDLKLKAGAESSFVENALTYQGFSILTPGATLDLLDRLNDYLTQQILPDYYEANGIPGDQQTPDYLAKNWETVKNWYEGEQSFPDDAAKAQDAIFVALYAYGATQNLDCMTQMIGGLNDTLLLAQPILQLEVDDPLTTNPGYDQPFHEQVRWTLGDSLQYKILEGDIFNPIRSGGMKLERLWLIDSFGQYKPIIDSSESATAEVITTTEMTPPIGSNYQVLLAPRLAQAARINFHWLAADKLNEVQMTTTPTRNPVCGWLVPNNLDSSLAVYDREGKSLGSLDFAGNWRNAPGEEVSRDNNPVLPNNHLQKVVNYLLGQGVEFQQQFISTLNNSLETIDPESFREHPSLALLVGSAIAVVRATFSLEVKGLPACDPTVVITEEGQEPVTNGFTEVKFPIRLGDYQQLNDGLVGYWREVPNGVSAGYTDYSYENDTFYATQSDILEENNIVTEAEGIIYFEQTVDAPTQGVTMLIDPRGMIHVTSGIVPNQELRLPPNNYSQALQEIEVNFLSTPILSNIGGEIAIPVPKEADFTWSWVSLEGNNWSETTELQPINPKASFSKNQEVYEGWLQLSRVEESNE